MIKRGYILSDKQHLENFQQVKNLRQEVSELCNSHISALSLFHLNHDLAKVKEKSQSFQGFSNSPDKTGKINISIASSATCIRSLLVNSDFEPEIPKKSDDFLAHLDQRLKDGSLGTKGLPPLNPFTVSQLLPVLKELEVPPSSSIVQAGLDSLKKAITSSEDGISIKPYPPNGYLTYWALVSLEKWQGFDKARELMSSCLKWSEFTLYRQISLFSAGDAEESDAYQLGYNLLIQCRYAKERIKESIISLALKTLFEAQLSRGLWEKKYPIFVYDGSGDAYCFTFEFLSSLLKEFKGNEQMLIDYLPNFKQSLRWAQRNIVAHAEIACWRSGNKVDNNKPESWATAEVYQFLQLFKDFLSQYLQRLALKELQGVLRKSKPMRDALSILYQPLVHIPAEKQEFPLNLLLEERLLEPLKLTSDKYSLVKKGNRKRLIRSGILFGPPGTGKTTYAEAIAKYLGWPIVMLDPSVFAKEGLSLIPNVTSRIFDLLVELEDTVILFDEMEVLIRKRKGDDSGGFEEKFLTTTLLPKLQELANRASSIFIIATNHFEDIDEAAKREGRFDFNIQVLPPSLDAKIKMLGTHGKLADPDKDNAINEMRRSERKIGIATRGEMLTLIDAMNADPKNIRDILDAFTPKLDKHLKKIEEEKQYNLFPYHR